MSQDQSEVLETNRAMTRVFFFTLEQRELDASSQRNHIYDGQYSLRSIIMTGRGIPRATSDDVNKS